jgi:hypothetical protein
VSVRFDDESLVSCAGIVPVMRLAENLGLGKLIDERVDLGVAVGANSDAKALSIIAGMVIGADSIDDLDVIRHGAMPRLFDRLRAPSTCGSWLRGFTGGHARQLTSVAAEALVRLSGQVPLLPGAGQVAFIDIDAKIKEVHGHHKDGAGFSYNGIRGLNYLVATVSSPICAPVILTAQLRSGNTDSRRGAVAMLREAINLARRAGATGMIVVRADSAFYTGPIIAAIRKTGAHFSITARKNEPVQAAIDTLGEDAWSTVEYRHPILDAETGEWITHAEIAEITHTAFTNPTQNRGRSVTARLLVRRTPRFTTNDQGELFRIFNYHAVFTDTRVDLITADTWHRGHAIIEQVFADLNDAALAHLPSGRFAANQAWLTLACLTHNLLRATGALASAVHAKARTATLRRHLINIPARVTTSARRIILRLPTNWPWQHSYQGLFDATHRTT